MASLHKESDRGRDGYRLRFRDAEQKQRSVWLGKMSRRSADTTITNYKHAKQWLVEFFTSDKPLIDVTPADCDRFQRFLNDKLAASTAEKILKRSKTMFRHAVRDRLLEENPFEDLKIGASVNRSRDYFVSTELAQRILRACPNELWQTVFALARYGGLRTPSETLNVRWDDVEWQEGRIRIESPKTGLRYCPLFPELEDPAGGPVRHPSIAVGRLRVSWERKEPENSAATHH